MFLYFRGITMKRTTLATILFAGLGTATNINASEIGAKIVDYENGTGSEYTASIDVKYNLSLEGRYSGLNLEECSLLNASKGEDQNPDVKLVTYGIGYTYPVSYELEVYAGAYMTTLKTSGLTYSIFDTGSGESQNVEIELEEIEGKEFEVGVAYKFADYFEIDVAAKQIHYDDDLSDDVTAGFVGLSVYINPRFKLTASYQSDTFLQESNYGLGITYKF